LSDSRMNAYTLLFLFGCFLGPTFAGNGEPPQVYDNVRTKFRVPAGKPFKLSCPVKMKSNEDVVMVRWTKDEELIGSEWGSKYKLLNSNRDLKIRNPQKDDTGKYRCMAINGFGHKEVEFTLEVYDPTKEDTDPSLSITLTTDGKLSFTQNSINDL
jgi:hypothetical protein